MGSETVRPRVLREQEAQTSDTEHHCVSTAVAGAGPGAEGWAVSPLTQHQYIHSMNFPAQFKGRQSGSTV